MQTVYILPVMVILYSQVGFRSESLRGCAAHQPTSAWATPACLQVGGPSTSTTDHGALPYRAAHKAVNPSRAGPMLILIYGVNPGTTVHAGPLRSRSAYQVSPVYDHSAISTPLPTNSQPSEPSGWQKDLGQIFVHWVGCFLTAPHSTTYNTHYLLAVFVSSPVPTPAPIVSRKVRTGIASLFLASTRRCSRSHKSPVPSPPWEQELFSDLDDCGRTNPTTCRTNSPGMATPEGQQSQPRRGWMRLFPSK